MFSKWKDARTRRRLKLIAQIQYLRKEEFTSGNHETAEWCNAAIEAIQTSILPVDFKTEKEDTDDK